MDLAKSMMEGTFLDRSKIFEAEKSYNEYLAKMAGDIPTQTPAKAASAGSQSSAVDYQTQINLLMAQVKNLTVRVAALESGLKAPKQTSVVPAAPKPTQVPAAEEDEDDSDDDLFDSDEEEDAEAEKIKQERIAMYAAKKSNKKAIIAKSSIILDVKPWDDETDMAALEKCVRTIEADGLVWGTSKLVKIAYGISKLQIICVVEDDKVGTDFLEEQICSFEDYIQSVDIVAFNKI